MKILSIAGRNLNSLRLDFKVDFTQGILKDCGIFAITGPTGAGKTTLLDAITLALYGRTPRAASDEDIISYGAGEAWAEVVFQTAEGKFKSEWKVRRARSRHDGTLQQSSMEVSTYPDGKILTHRKREALDKVKELIKLEYDQFLKSVLLAQGAFKAFLDAREGERGAMLEKISDTSLYTLLSKKAFERKRDEEHVLEVLKETMGNVVLLSEEERTANEKMLREWNELEQERQKEFTDLQYKSNWLQTINELTQNLINAEKEMNFSRQQLEKERHNLQRWEAHQQVASFEPEWLQYTGKMQDLLALKNNMEKRKGILSELEKKRAGAEAALAVAQKQANEAAKSREDKMPRILEAITRSGDITAIKKELEVTAGKQKAKISEEYACKKKIVKNQDAVTRDKELREKLANWIGQNQRYAEAGASFTQASLLANQLKRSLDDIISYSSMLLKGEQQLSQTQALLTEAKNNEEKAFQVQKKLLETRNHTSKQLCMLKGRLMVQAQESRQHFEKTTRQLEAYNNHLSRQQFLAEHLSKLHEGEPCPLCGALEYPNQSLSVPEVATALKEIKSKLKEYQVELTTIEQQQRLLEKMLGNLDDFPVITATGPEPLPQNLETIFRLQMQEWKSLPERENAVSLELISGKQLRHNLSGNIFHFETAKKQAMEKLQFTRDEMAGQLKDLENIAIHYDVKFDPEHPEKLPEILKTYSEEYRQKTNQALVLESTIPGMEAGIETLKEQLKSLRDDLVQLQKEIDDKNTIISCYRNEISIAHTGFASPEAARDKLYNDEKAANDLLKTITVRFNNMLLETGKIEGENSNAAIVLIELEQTIKNLEISLETKLLALGWQPDIDLITTKLLLGNERVQLGDLYKSLHHAMVISTSHLQSCKTQLDFQRSLKITDESAGMITEKIGKVTEALQYINRELGRIGEVIKVDNLKKEQLKEVRKKIDDQENVLRKWADLSYLIGSADGKKFNQFAQGLTLDRLILVANHHLELLNDRYLLKRNTSDQGLRLLIIDRYQADNEREINTLSGGESFLVSLALALGLSEMTSKLTTIDSLFIDEGFGTLDADTLEVALNALRGLQISGKTIGIISHVERLKEEIYIQVEITKGADGFSSVKVIP